MQKKFKKTTVFKAISLCLGIVLITFNSGYSQSARPNRIAQLVSEKKQVDNFKQVSLFTSINDQELNQFVTKGSALILDQNQLSKIMTEKSNTMTLNLSYVNGQHFELELFRADIFSPGFLVGTKGVNNSENINYNPGIYYRGIVKGDNNSIASISFFNEGVMGIFSDNSGNYNLGEVKGKPGHYVLYNDKDVIVKPVVDCTTPFKMPENETQGKNGGGNGIASTNCKIVHCYYECDFAMYQDFSSNVNTTSNYLTGAFNVEATLYLNDGVTIEISQIFVWTSTDPQASFTTTSTVNNSFSTQTGGTFNGDMAQFLTTRSLGGGVAQGFNGLCNKTQAHSSAEIYTTYSPFPTYSWTVMVMTHEMGHLLGSRHTHACVWNGNSTAIDGCAGGVEGSCALPGNPPGGGTIMSYCHLTGVGINLNLGFGPQPAALILGNVTSAVCLTGSSAGTPTGLTTTSITGNSAILNWAAVSGATQYTVEYKLTSAGSYTVLGNYTTTTANLPGLSSSSAYTWHVQADCSPFASATFTTLANTGCGVPTGLTTTTIKSTTAKLNWSGFGGAANYKVKYKVFGTTTWKYVTANNAYKNLSNLVPNTQYSWQVKSNCTGGGTTSYSAIKNFTTQSLAAPTNYCTTNGTDPSLENITNVTFGTINNTTGNNGGYADFTAQSTNAQVGTTKNISVSIFRSNVNDIEFVKVWIDYNRDGDFTDANEAVFSGSSGTLTTFTGNVTIPATPNIGNTRMRVTVHYNSTMVPCGTYDYGETEDYQVNLTTTPALVQNFKFSDGQSAPIDFTVFPNPAHDNIQVNISQADDDYYNLSIVSVTGQQVEKYRLHGASNAVNISDLKSGFYQLQLIDKNGHSAFKKFIKE